MADAAKHLPHYTYDDYVQWEGRWELIHGIPHAMSPALSLRHQYVSANIAAALHAALKECSPCRALLPVDWKIRDDLVVQPDNLVVCTDLNGAYLTEPPAIIFEILSPSTAFKDRNTKFTLYEGQGVAYYCLVDTDKNRVEIYVLRDGVYHKLAEATTETVEFQLDACSFAFDFSAIWS